MKVEERVENIEKYLFSVAQIYKSIYAFKFHYQIKNWEHEILLNC